MRWTAIALHVAALALIACSPAMRRTGDQPPSDVLSELWIEPETAPRNLADGPPGAPPPPPDARFDILSRDTGGFSITYVVRDASGARWHVKIGPEARPEVVSSRIVWALGYHELPSYFVERWIGVEHGRGELFGGTRFRPHDIGLKNRGPWSWQRNRFVGTRPFNGLIVLMLVLNSTDLKNDNNGVYDLTGPPREGAARWYVVKDLGASLGATGRFDPRRDDVNAFEREPFITGVDHGHVRFGFHGRHQELLSNITPDDVRWTCLRLAKLTDAQYGAAFRAGHFSPDETARYIRKIRQKIQEGLALP